MVSALNWRVDLLVIGAALGAEKLGVYRLGNELSAMATFEVTNAMSPILHPSYVAIRSDRPRFLSLFTIALQSIYMMILPLGFGLALVSDIVVPIVLGEQWLTAIPLVQVIAPSLSVLGIVMTVESALLAEGRVRLLFQRECILFAFRMPLLLAGLYLGGLMGVVYARAAYALISFGIHALLVKQVFGLPAIKTISTTWRSWVSVSFMCLLIVVLREESVFDNSMPSVMMLLMLICGGGVTYIIAHGVLWVLSGRPDGAERRLIQIVKRT